MRNANDSGRRNDLGGSARNRGRRKEARMDETRADPLLDAPARPRAGSGVTPAQLKAAAKVVRAHLVQEAQRLRRIVPPPERDKPERPGS